MLNTLIIFILSTSFGVILIILLKLIISYFIMSSLLKRCLVDLRYINVQTSKSSNTYLDFNDFKKHITKDKKNLTLILNELCDNKNETNSGSIDKLINSYNKSVKKYNFEKGLFPNNLITSLNKNKFISINIIKINSTDSQY